MSWESLIIGLFIVGFPLLLILIQWMLIRHRLPWLGMLAGLIPPLLFWLWCLFLVLPKPEDCSPNIACEWVGIGVVVITLYTILVAVLSTLAGLIIHLVYRKRIWKHDEIVEQTGKIPALVFVVVMLVVIIYFALSITGLLYRFTIPEEGPYP
ncbi:hypothetical protein [Anaerolinea sp.]|uniref:hypothetical protein n=1 Tax=Anaerolinea sp. TaxID=1872519 RepID=UPI002ACDEBFA|nr:hypothetical protein [Anaerolinea sp.]